MINTNRLSINAIGKIKKPWIMQVINLYKKRMPDLLINEFKSFDLNKLKGSNSNYILISLSDEGKTFNSQEFASLLLGFNNNKIYFLY